MKGRLVAAAVAVLAGTIAHAVLAAPGAADPFGEFQKRFGGNQSFVCRGAGGKVLSVNVTVPEDDNDQMKAVPRAQWRQALTIDLSNGADGSGAPIVTSWGVPSFDASTRAMSIRLQSGKTLVFHRFRAIPDPDADRQHFDRKPYFDLAIDGAATLSCSQVFNVS